MENVSNQTKVLIVGGSGFLSGTLARRAVGRANKVWTITRGQKTLPEHTTNLIVDRHNRSAFEEAVKGIQTDWDIMIDCIAFTPQDIQQDVVVFENLTQHLVFVSTDFVYDPQHREFPQREDANHYVGEGYGHQKRLAELELINYAGKLPWTVVRPPHIYGPGSELGCLPAHSRDPGLIARLEAGEPLRLVGGGHFLQQPVLARDLADFLLDLQGKPETYSQILNAAGPDVIESRAYYQIVADVLGVELHIEELQVASYLAENPAASSFLCHRFYDMSKAAELGIPLPGTTMLQGLQEHVDGFKSN
jgi:nucleoside-diphosphate-sugar epimerase